MTEIFKVVGGVAGIGGIALIVFMQLFKRINLPPGTRRHLTLFMWLVWSICVAGIGAYLASIYSERQTQIRREKPQWVDAIWVTAPLNEKFIKFLEKNDGNTVHLSTELHMGVIDTETQNVSKEYGNPSEQKELFEVFAEDSEIMIPLEGSMSIHNLELSLLNHRTLQLSYAGPGAWYFSLTGYFKVDHWQTSGPKYVYTLTEVPVQLVETID